MEIAAPRDFQERVSMSIFDMVWVRSILEEKLYHLSVPSLACFLERAAININTGVDVATIFEQKLDDFFLVVANCILFP